MNGAWYEVKPVVDYAVRGLCVKPYPGHRKGCPNFGVKEGCPPHASLISEVFDLTAPCFCIVNTFDLSAHKSKMRLAHPDWSNSQLMCCLYWQGTARKALEGIITEFRKTHNGCKVTRCPEAMGLNVTATLASVGVFMEWPPVTKTLQVAFAGMRL